MYRIRHLSNADRQLFTRALRGDVDQPEDDTDTSDESDLDPTGGDTPTDPAPDPGANPMRVVTANVKHTMGRAQIEADVKKVATLGSVIMWQEVHAGTFRNAIRQHLPDSTWDHSGLQHEVPISVKRSLWDVRHATVYKLHNKWPQGDPARYLTVVLLKAQGSGVEFVVANSHLVANAWGNTHRPNIAWKQRMWNRSYDKFQTLVLNAQSKGLTIIGGGDWNKHDVPKFTAAQTWLRTAHVDYLFGLQASGGATFTLGANQSVSLNSDHNALVAQLSWAAGTNPVVDTFYCPGISA